MQSQLTLYNSLSNKKEIFKPIIPHVVTMYLCGPTVYGDPHIGHARSAVVFDVIFRYLKHIGYKVKYVRNITDVGHLERDSDDGEDKIIKQASIMGIDPMEVATHYTNEYKECMKLLNNQSPSIEPLATGHITEQIELIQKIITKRLAYEVNGSVYFNTTKYNETNKYGTLSGQIIENLIQSTNTEKLSSLDFALWKKANTKHIMKWPSPWGYGFPGWHIECLAMTNKYLGQNFDIHGGGMDLKFPHHECELAQSKAALNSNMAQYWVHHNLITVNKQKMGKSLNNSVNLKDIFYKNPKVHPMAVRLFLLQAHYRSTLDFSYEAIKSSEIAYIKLLNGLLTLSRIVEKYNDNFTERNDIPIKNNAELEKEIINNCNLCYEYINDDINTPKVIANLFLILKYINEISNNKIKVNDDISYETFKLINKTYETFLVEIIGISDQEKNILSKEILDYIIKKYKIAKREKDYTTIEEIRYALAPSGITILDTPNDVLWQYQARTKQ